MTNANRNYPMDEWLRLYQCMWAARRLEEVATDLARRGEIYFHLGGDGHEATAALALALRPEDWLHPHYRDIALMLARGLPVAAFVHAWYATDLAATRGRDMPPFQCDPDLHLMPMPTLVGNNALHAVGVAAQVCHHPARPIVYCGIGDGGSQQGEFLEAIAEAVRSRLPVLFFVQDNRYALSTPTAGRTWYHRPDGPADEFYGLPIVRIPGPDVFEVARMCQELVSGMRADRQPRLAIFECPRLVSHSNSDDHTVYRTPEDLERERAERDPLPRFRSALLRRGVAETTLADIERGAEQEIQTAVEAARSAPAPRHGPARRPLPPELEDPRREYRGGEGEPRLSMQEAIRETLRQFLEEDPSVVLYGQDIEDPKGDVFGVTRGLSTRFPGRVQNSPLAESTIVGTAVGRALAGGRPIVFLQFADFFPVAYNQLVTELAAIWWRSGERFEVPVLVLAICGGYRPGLGPFHAQSPEAPLAAMPGLDIVMPSTAGDAAGLLRAAFASRRPTVFLYPKALLNDRRRGTTPDLRQHFVPVGCARHIREGTDLTLITWGNTVPHGEEAAELLGASGVQVDLFDLRWLSPWDRTAILESARKTRRVLVAHEAQPFCGLGAEILATVAEEAGVPVEVARVTGPDSLLPYHAGLHMSLLPTCRTIVDRAARILDLEVRWETVQSDPPGWRTVVAVGSSPSDENIRILRYLVGPGEAVQPGRILAHVEADKAPHEIGAPVSGTVAEILVPEGEVVPAGTPILRLRDVRSSTTDAMATSERVHIRRRSARPACAVRTGSATNPVYIAAIRHATGSRQITNEDLVRNHPDWNAADVVQRTGIERRFWIGPGENVLTLAVQACQKLFAETGLQLSDFDAVICSTGTPLSTTPSLACRILRELNGAGPAVEIQAHDINAACTGYLYALQQAWDILQYQPSARVLLVTAETLSPVLDPSDPDTIFLFGDAATASVISREPLAGGLNLRSHRPVLSALGEDERVLFVPALNSGEHVSMDGKRVFRVAVRKMIEILERACRERGLKIADLSMIVPHQANERIIEAIQKAMRFPVEKVCYHIRDYGNTSSNTIPLALEALFANRPAGQKIGLTAFGGGFTFGAAILETT